MHGRKSAATRSRILARWGIASLAALLVVATQSLIGTSPASAASTPPAYYPSGPQVNVPVATVTDGGWTECFVDKYADGLHAALPGLLDACTGKYLMLAGRATGSSTLGLLAAAPRDDVLFDTGTGDTTHVANGTGWYFADNWSWGFAKAGDSVERSSCDVASVDGALRLCWHTAAYGGFRLGTDTTLNGSTDFERVVYQTGVQKITFTSTAPADAVPGDTYTAAATGGASGNPVVLSIAAASSSVCSLDGSTVTFNHPGTCTVDADQDGNGDFSAGHGEQAITVSKIAQPVTFTSTAPTDAVAGTTYDVTATGGASGKPVTLSIDPASSSLCSVDGSTVTFAHAGDCVVDADQGGNTDYAAATRSQQTVAVGKAAQAITFTSTAPADAVVGGTYDLTATGGASGKPVTFSIDPASSDVCSVDGSTVTFAHAGDCVVDADQAGDSDYRAATQSQQTVAVGKAAQAIAFSSTVPTGAVLGDTYDVTATGGASGSPVGFSIDAASSDVCSVDGSTVTFLHAGDCVVDADQDGTADYTAAPQSQQTVTVVKTDQAITFTSAAPTDAVVGATYDVVASGGASGNAVSFSVDPASSDVCSVDGSTVTFAHTGECVVDADQDSTADYNAAPQSQQTVTVSKAAQAVAFTSTAPADAVVGATYDVAATGGASGNPVAFAIADDSSDVCSLDGSTVTFAHPGDCVVDADQDGSTDYVAAAQVEQHVAVAQASTTTGIMVKRGQIVAHVTANAPGAGTPTGSVDFTVGTTQVGSARLVDGIATLTHDVAAGATRTVAARYRGDADFTASSASTARKDPRITASVSSTAPKSGRGWYSAPVTVHFHCSTNGAPLATACPAPVTLRANRAGQTATGTVAAVDGGIATAAVSGINIDTVKPKVRIRGIHRGATYVQKPKPRCVGHDQLSGVVSCRLTHRKVGNRIRWKAVATDKAGNTRKVTVRTTVLPVDVQGAHQSGGVFSVTSGRTYTLVVKGSATRPVYYDAALAPHRPVQRDKAFLPAGHHRWALGVTMAPHMDSHSRWNLGVKIGGKLLIVKVRIR